MFIPLKFRHALPYPRQADDRPHVEGESMGAALVCAVLACAIPLAWLTPRWRLARALARPLTPDQLKVIEDNVAQYAGMSPELRDRLQRLVKQFLFEKTFVGCAGLEVTEEMRVTIAAQACLLLVGSRAKRPRVYPDLHAVLVYPGAFLVPRQQRDEAGVVTETRQDLLGESWGDGRVVLSWEHVRRAGLDPQGTHNVVLHEFAHQLDSASGSTNGAPFLGSPERYRSWSYSGYRDVLDPYGATNPAEFFAVATEAFFELPHALAARHPELYGEFQAYYRVDPREWLAPEPQSAWSEPLSYGEWR
jgi:Mlc titration factor MtfA (ptsG expression regulator)